jgi:hypothetical protein
MSPLQNKEAGCTVVVQIAAQKRSYGVFTLNSMANRQFPENIFVKRTPCRSARHCVVRQGPAAKGDLLQ